MRFVGPDFREATGLATVKIASRHVPPRTKGVHLDVRALALWTNAAVLHATYGAEKEQEGRGQAPCTRMTRVVRNPWRTLTKRRSRKVASRSAEPVSMRNEDKPSNFEGVATAKR